MPKHMTVVVGVSCVDGSDLVAETQPVTIKLELNPEADSHAEAIVKALRHGAEVAAARLGLPLSTDQDVRAAAEALVADIRRRNAHREVPPTGFASVGTDALDRLHKALRA